MELMFALLKIYSEDIKELFLIKNSREMTPSEILEAHENVIAILKLNRILQSKSIQDFPVYLGDKFHVNIKVHLEKEVKGHLRKHFYRLIEKRALLLFLEKR